MKRDDKAIIRRLTDQMAARGAEALLLTGAGSITYVTGFHGWDSIVVLTADGKIRYIASEFSKQAILENVSPDIDVITFPCWIYIEDYVRPGEVKETQPDPLKIFRLAADFLPEKGRIAVEASSLSFRQHLYLAEAFGEDHLIAAEPILSRAAAVKTPWEIEQLRSAAVASEKAMHCIASHAYPGISVRELCRQFSEQCFLGLPGTQTVYAHHSIAGRFAPATVPSDDRVQAADLVCLSGGPNATGYPSDISRTFIVGKSAGREDQQVFDALQRGHETLLSKIRPGQSLSRLARETADTIRLPGQAQLSGIFGYALDCLGFEDRMAAGAQLKNDTVFETGNVFSIGAACRTASHREIRIMDTVLVTETGFERFTAAPPCLFF